MATPNMKSLYELEQMMMGAAQPESAGTPATYRSIIANPVDLDTYDIDLSAPEVVPFKAPVVKSTAMPKMDTQGVKSRALTDQELAQREADSDHSTDILVASMEKLANTLSNRENDNMLYNSARAHSAEKVRKAEKNEANDLKIAQILKTSVGDAQKLRESDPTSADSVTFRNFFKNTEYGKSIPEDTLANMSKKDMMATIPLAGSEAQLKLAGLTANKETRAQDTNSTIAQGIRNRLTKGDLVKFAPKGVDLSALTAAELREYESQALKEQDQAYDRADKANQRAHERAMENFKMGNAEVQKFGEKYDGVYTGKQLVDTAKRLLNGKGISEGGMASKLINEWSSGDDPAQRIVKGLLEQNRSAEEKQLIQTMGALNFAASKAGGGVVTDGDRRAAETLNNLKPGAPKEELLNALKIMETNLEAKERLLQNLYPQGYQILNQRMGGDGSAKPQPNSPPKKAQSGKLKFQLSDGRQLMIPADKRQDFMSKFPDAKEIK